MKSPVVVQDGRHDAGGAVGRRGDHAAARGVLLVHRQRVEGHPLHRPQRVGVVAVGLQLGAQRGGAPADLEAAGKHAGGAGPALDALLHHRPDVQQTLADLGLAAPGELVGEHDVADPQPGLARVRQQLLAGAERVADRCAVLDDHRVAGFVLVEDEAAAHGVVLAPVQLGPVGVHRPEDHPVAVEVQPLAAVQDDVVVHGERDRVLAGQRQLARAADGLDARIGRARVDELGPFALQPQDDGLDAAVPVPGRAERAEQLAADPGDPREQPLLLQAEDEGAGGPHRADGVRTGRADPDLEQVEGADGHRSPSSAQTNATSDISI